MSKAKAPATKKKETAQPKIHKVQVAFEDIATLLIGNSMIYFINDQEIELKLEEHSSFDTPDAIFDELTTEFECLQWPTEDYEDLDDEDDEDLEQEDHSDCDHDGEEE
jgi:hypothetical protein